MNTALIDEKISTMGGIEAIGLSERERSRALACLGKAEAIVGAFLAVRKLLKGNPRQAVVRPSLRSQ
jgi:hypothetical protein